MHLNSLNNVKSIDDHRLINIAVVVEEEE